MSIELAKQFHTIHLAPRIGPPVGANPQEVEALGRKLGVLLPQSYQDFLLWMGRDHKGIFRGSAWFIDCVLSNKDALRAILEETGSRYLLKDSHVVFFTHQGYMAAWFDAELANPDPECWFMNDGMSEPRATGRFSQALLRDLEGLARRL